MFVRLRFVRSLLLNYIFRLHFLPVIRTFSKIFALVAFIPQQGVSPSYRFFHSISRDSFVNEPRRILAAASSPGVKSSSCTEWLNFFWTRLRVHTVENFAISCQLPGIRGNRNCRGFPTSPWPMPKTCLLKPDRTFTQADRSILQTK